ncbi:ribonuclease H-like domain-containing protein [Xylariaceae sp. FL0594]|nr:ribonuclease H-like domain-containing protein [Xylariaceae sp. FL0594]
MGYMMDFYVSGMLSKRNKWESAIAARFMHRGSKPRETRVRRLSVLWSSDNTIQRAELLAVMMALRWALARYGKELKTRPKLKVRIHTDSRYAVDVMNVSRYKWAYYGWKNSKGEKLRYRDLIQQVAALDDKLRELGSVHYILIPRDENKEAIGAGTAKLNGDEPAEELEPESQHELESEPEPELEHEPELGHEQEQEQEQEE